MSSRGCGCQLCDDAFRSMIGTSEIKEVPAEVIENLVGVKRHPILHYALAQESLGSLTVLHSQECFDASEIMSSCPFTRAMHSGLFEGAWAGQMDVPVVACIFRRNGRTWLGPATTAEDWFHDPELKNSQRIKDLELSVRRGGVTGNAMRVDVLWRRRGRVMSLEAFPLDGCPDRSGPPDGWYRFGTHAGWDNIPMLEFSEERDEAGMPFWERPPAPEDLRSSLRDALDESEFRRKALFDALLKIQTLETEEAERDELSTLLLDICIGRTVHKTDAEKLAAIERLLIEARGGDPDDHTGHDHV